MPHSRFGPFDRQLGPQIFGEHPAETGKEIGAVEQLRLRGVHNSSLAIVIPRGHAPQAGVLLEQLVRAQEVLKEVGRHVQIVLDDYDELKAHSEGGVQGPAVVSGYLVVAFEFFLLRQHCDVAEIRLLDERDLFAIREDCLLGGLIAAVLY